MKLVEAAPAEARLAPVAKGGATLENLLVEALVLLAKRNPNPFCLLLVRFGWPAASPASSDTWRTKPDPLRNKLTEINRCLAVPRLGKSQAFSWRNSK